MAVVSPGEVRGRIAAALANVDAVLAKARPTRANLISLGRATTDIDAYLARQDAHAE